MGLRSSAWITPSSNFLLDSFNDDERLLAQVTIGIVRSGGAMYTGRLLECVAARILDASFPTVGISPWDLALSDGTRIEIRSGATKFSLAGRKDVDLWIFIHKLEPVEPFTVLTAAEVADLRAGSKSSTRLADRFGRVGSADLPRAVAEALATSTQ